MVNIIPLTAAWRIITRIICFFMLGRTLAAAHLMPDEGARRYQESSCDQKRWGQGGQVGEHHYPPALRSLVHYLADRTERAKRSCRAAERPQPARPADQDHRSRPPSRKAARALLQRNPVTRQPGPQAAARVADRRYPAYASDPRSAAAACARTRLLGSEDPGSAFSRNLQTDLVKGLRFRAAQLEPIAVDAGLPAYSRYQRLRYSAPCYQ